MDDLETITCPITRKPCFAEHPTEHPIFTQETCAWSVDDECRVLGALEAIKELGSLFDDIVKYGSISVSVDGGALDTYEQN